MIKRGNLREEAGRGRDVGKKSGREGTKEGRRRKRGGRI